MTMMAEGENQINVGRLSPGTSALFVCDMQVGAIRSLILMIPPQ